MIHRDVPHRCDGAMKPPALGAAVGSGARGRRAALTRLLLAGVQEGTTQTKPSTDPQLSRRKRPTPAATAPDAVARIVGRQRGCLCVCVYVCGSLVWACVSQQPGTRMGALFRGEKPLSKEDRLSN